MKKFYVKSELHLPYHTPDQKEFYFKRCAEFDEVQIGFDKIVFLGDSITEGGGNWNNYFRTKSIVNRGISGDTTLGVLARLNEICFYKPISLFLLIGINDIYAINLPESKQTEKHITNNIIKILETLRNKSPQTKLYLQTILPTHREDIKDQIKRINSGIINKVQPEITVIDLYSIFANDNDLMTNEYTTDGVHLNTYGYDNWINHIQ